MILHPLATTTQALAGLLAPLHETVPAPILSRARLAARIVTLG